jgi:Protein of unknown function (DUF1501)
MNVCKSFQQSINRRNFLRIGGTSLCGVSLLDLLGAQGKAASGKPKAKHMICCWMGGGPPHLDMFDMKPDAPAEIRGEFKPIATNVPGIEICELFPEIAKRMDKFLLVRSIVGSAGDHDAYQCMTGYKRPQAQMNNWPSFGAWVSKVQGPANRAMPPHMSLMYPCGERRWGYPGEGGFLGMAHAPFNLVNGKSEKLQSENMSLKGVTLDQLEDRVALMKSFDTLKRSIDDRGAMDGIDSYNQQALGILTSSKLVDALDLNKEDPKVLERYGKDDFKFERDGAPRMVRNFCVARRLVEAGARVVTLNFTRWDWHGSDGKNFVQARKDFPLLDHALSSLVQDLHDRGLDQDVSVIVWGEFGRTPKINKDASRDHWPQVSAAIMAGGGMKTGQAIGATNPKGEHAVKRPVSFQEIFATLYTNVGVDLRAVREFDANGRPQYPVEPGTEPMHEVL